MVMDRIIFFFDVVVVFKSALGLPWGNFIYLHEIYYQEIFL